VSDVWIRRRVIHSVQKYFLLGNGLPRIPRLMKRDDLNENNHKQEELSRESNDTIRAIKPDHASDLLNFLLETRIEGRLSRRLEMGLSITLRRR